MDLRRTSNPLTIKQKLEVVSLADARQQARVSHGVEDGLFQGYIETAFDFLSGQGGWLNGYHLLEETFSYYVPSWSPVCIHALSSSFRRFELPARPFGGVISFEWLQPDGSYLEVAPSLFAVTSPDGEYAAISRVGTGRWPYTGVGSPLAYRVTFKAGHATPALVPAPLKQAIKLLVTEFYENRSASVDAVRPEALYGLKALAGRYKFAKDHS